MEKMDLRKELKHLYKPSAKEVVRVDVPTMDFLMIDGRGDPSTSQGFSEGLEALFSLSYALKFMARNGGEGVDYPVMPLEALWWAEDMTAFTSGDKADWLWTMMMMQPPPVTAEMVRTAIDEVGGKKALAALPLVRYEPFTEGRSAQIMHVGPFSEEGPTIARLHDFIAAAGRELRGKHHEIYLSDMRRSDPSNWRTVIRQPMT